MSITGSKVLDRDLHEHVFETLSDAEFERRWQEVRRHMDEQGVDVLVMQNIGDGIGGYTRYFTDVAAYRGYPVAVVFARDGSMTMVTHGPRGGDRTIAPGEEGHLRGVSRVITDWTFLSGHYCGGYDADLVLSVLAPYRHGVVGLVGTAQMSGAFLEHLRAGLGSATVVEVSELVDRVKAVKSDEELARIRICAAIQEQALERMFATARPGRTELECLLAAEQLTRELGSDQAVMAFGSGPPGVIPSSHKPRSAMTRRLEKGDWVKVLVESNGPDGWYTELGRIAVIGSPDKVLVEEAAVAAELQDYTMGLLTPGRPCSEVFAAYNDRLRELKLPEERRVHTHGQGYEIVERPLVRSDETMEVAAGMSFACHPAWEHEGGGAWMCDNFVIGADGAPERLHTLPRCVVEL